MAIKLADILHQFHWQRNDPKRYWSENTLLWHDRALLETQKRQTVVLPLQGDPVNVEFRAMNNSIDLWVEYLLKAG